MPTAPPAITIAAARMRNQTLVRLGSCGSVRFFGAWTGLGGVGTRLFFLATAERYQAVASALSPKNSATAACSPTTGAGGRASRKRRP
jgi:hypothetical protein